MQEIYPATLSDAGFVEAIYQNVFGRESDEGGLSYWTDKLSALRDNLIAQGQDPNLAKFEARGQLVMNMMDAALNAPDGTRDKAYVSNRLEVATYAVEKQLASGVEIPLAVLEDALNATENDDHPEVDTDPSTILEGKAEIDNFFAPPAAPLLSLANDTGGSATDGITSSGVVNVSGLEAGATWEYSLDGGSTWIAGSGTSIDLTSTGDGAKSVIARQTTSNGTSDNSAALAFTLDTTAPVFQSAATSTDGSKIILTYDSELDDTNTAGTSAFEVKVNGNARGVGSVAVQGSTVELTLQSAINSGETVTVAYTDPSVSDDPNAVQDIAGNDADSLSAQSVNNNVTGPNTAPVFKSRTGKVIVPAGSGHSLIQQADGKLVLGGGAVVATSA